MGAQQNGPFSICFGRRMLQSVWILSSIERKRECWIGCRESSLDYILSIVEIAWGPSANQSITKHQTFFPPLSSRDETKYW